MGRLFAKAYERTDAHGAAQLVQAGAVLLDVREPHEWTAGHAPMARHIPLSQLARRSGELPSGRRIVTVCRSGHRSAKAATTLASTGWQVTNLCGGMRAWARAGMAVVAKGGRPGHVA